LTAKQEVEEMVTLAMTVLPSNELSEVQHFLDHDEYEMAFEGLIIQLSRHGAALPNRQSREIRDLAERLGLRAESVFAGNFWDIMNLWLRQVDPSQAAGEASE